MTRLSRSLACLAVVPLLIAACGGASGTASPTTGANAVPTPNPSAATSFVLPSIVLPSFAIPSFVIPSFTATGDVTVKLDASGVDGLAPHYEAKPAAAGCTVGLIGPELLYVFASVSDPADPSSYAKNWAITLIAPVKAPAPGNTHFLFTFGGTHMSDPNKPPKVYSAGGGIGQADVKVDDAGATLTVKATGTATSSLPGPDLTYSLEVACNNVQRP
jgi:hypothetical protein